MTTKPQHHLSRCSLWRSRIPPLHLSRVLYKFTLFMQNKPNLPRFCAKNAYSEEKQSQFKPNQAQFQGKYAQNKPNQTQFFTSFILPYLPIHPNQTQSQTTPLCRGVPLNEAKPSTSSILLRLPVRRSFSEDGSFMRRRIDFDFAVRYPVDCGLTFDFILYSLNGHLIFFQLCRRKNE